MYGQAGSGMLKIKAQDICEGVASNNLAKSVGRVAHSVEAQVGELRA